MTPATPQDPRDSIKPTSAVDEETERVRQAYEESPHISWADFAASCGWNVQSSRVKYPTAKWVAEKRARLSREHAECLQDALTRARPQIHQDTLRTLRDYPEAHDAMLDLIKSLGECLRAETEEHARGVRASQMASMKVPALRRGLVKDLLDLTIALRTLTESKHRSLMLTEATWKAVVEDTERVASAEPGQAAQEGDGMTFRMMGWESITPDRLDKFFSQYFDKPQVKAEPSEEAELHTEADQPAVL